MIQKLPTLYTANKSGTIQHWTIEIRAHQTRTVYGQLDGKVTTSEWYDSEAKNEGRANARTASEQAMFEAKVVWQKKIDKDATENLAELRVKMSAGAPRMKENCMLANKWSDLKSKTLKKSKTLSGLFPLYCQPKLDGMRALISLGPDGKVQAVSRNKKPWITIPHILKSLEPLFAKYPKLILDGELYNHDLHDDFDKIASLIKRTKPSAEDLKASAEMVRFYWYDVCLPDKSFVDRRDLIGDLIGEFGFHSAWSDKTGIVQVETAFVNSEAQLDDVYARYLEQGYEGQMVRLNEGYQFERSWSLLKRKEWQTDEFKVLVIGEGNGNKKGQAAYAFLELPDGSTSRTNIKGTAENRIKLLQNKDALVGKWATTQYFNITPKGGLRFPYIFAIQDAPYLRVRAGRGKDN